VAQAVHLLSFSLTVVLSSQEHKEARQPLFNRFLQTNTHNYNGTTSDKTMLTTLVHILQYSTSIPMETYIHPTNTYICLESEGRTSMCCTAMAARALLTSASLT